MNFDEYLKERDSVTDNIHRYAIYRHVGYRLQERLGIPQRNLTLDIWQKVSYACATRQYPVLFRKDDAVLLTGNFFGRDLIWVYSRMLRCVVTVYPKDHKFYDYQYREEVRKLRY